MAAPMQGVYTGVVVDTADPLKRGRVRLQVPQLTGLTVSTWAAPAGHGVASIGDRVSVAFDGADRNYPVFWPVQPVPVYVPPSYTPPVLSWSTLTLTAKYVHGSTSGWHDVQYAVDIQNVVLVRGLTFASPSVAAGDVITTLPLGTVVQEIFPVAAGSAAGGSVRVQPDGQMIVHTAPSPSANWLSFNFFYDPNH